MMKTTKQFLVVFILLFSMGGGVVYADFQAGLDAAQKEDYATALREWKPLAEAGNAGAQHNLARMYYNGYGVPQDYKTAVKWYEKAAQQGVATAQVNLGGMYRNGQGVPQDYKEARKWTGKAAQQGDADAQYNLGLMYRYGEGAPQDDKEAVKWYEGGCMRMEKACYRTIRKQ